MNKRYDKEKIEEQALLSAEQGRLTEPLGLFIIERANEIARSSFYVGSNDELLQALIDEAVMRCCEKFLHYYKPNKSAANLIISIIYSTMYNKIESLKWRDVYGERIKGRVYSFEDGRWKRRLVKFVKDENYDGFNQ